MGSVTSLEGYNAVSYIGSTQVFGTWRLRSTRSTATNFNVMTIKDLRDILIHFQDSKYDNYEIVLWDYNQQQELDWGFGYGLSHPDKKLTFPVHVQTVDGETIMERLKKLKDDLEG